MTDPKTFPSSARIPRPSIPRYSGVYSPSTVGVTSEHLTRFEKALDSVGLLKGEPSLVYKRAALIALVLSGITFVAVPSLVYNSEQRQVNWTTFLGLPLSVFVLAALFI